ncbi:acyltransferase [Paenibacillus frigoriresistens]|uniref:acyltransferase family protein n=1 Tax=Paenibacillus alginolyticus TaxID=59839 RepID=UPI001565168C|nr:acyltransferase [Paenibacillus frigoriresistens]NRF90530.1 acyltransferase [Paenibacillus frigoriresistens]
MNNRIEQLDSIRGLAALIVFLSHIPMIGLPLVFTNLLKALGVINGHASVIIFFVLSGFVLSIPFFKKNEMEYLPYLIKRMFRIYLPYIAAMIFAIVLSQIFYTISLGGLGDWSNKLWNTQVTAKLIIEHIYLIGNTPTNAFNGVIWSLIHELRISLIFPIILLLVKRYDWKISILFCVLLSVVAGLNNIFHIQTSNGYLVTYFDSIAYLSIFILGALVAKHREQLLTLYLTLNTRSKWKLLGISFCFYNYFGYMIYYSAGKVNIELFTAYSLILIEHGTALGAIGFLIIAIGSTRVSKILMRKPIVFLGKISYSLYLFHMPILLCCVYVLYGKVSILTLCIIATVLSISLSTLAWLFIENPCNTMGRLLATNMKNGKNKRFMEMDKVA